MCTALTAIRGYITEPKRAKKSQIELRKTEKSWEKSIKAKKSQEKPRKAEKNRKEYVETLRNEGNQG